jgi:uncharacterized protein YndB with AHSA1/START domain
MQYGIILKKAIPAMAIALSLLACNNDSKGDKTGTVTTTEKQSTMKNDSNHTENIVLVRTIATPIETVFKAWTDPEIVKRWWGPRSFTSPTCKIDLREGGTYVFSMQPPGDPQGKQAPPMYTSGTYAKVAPNQYLEFGQRISDKDGNPIDPSTLGMPADFPKEPIRTSISLESRGGITVMTVTEYDWKTGPMRDMSALGLGECLDKLIEYLLTGKTR